MPLDEDLVPVHVGRVLEAEEHVSVGGAGDVFPRDRPDRAAVAGAEIPLRLRADLEERLLAEIDMAGLALGVAGDGALIDDGGDDLLAVVPRDLDAGAAGRRVVVVRG